MAKLPTSKIMWPGSTAANPLPSNTNATAYPAIPQTRLIVLDATNPEEIEAKAEVVDGKTLISVVWKPLLK